MHCKERTIIKNKNFQVLIVEDNSVNAMLMISVVSTVLKYNYLLAENGRIGLELFKTNKFNLVLTDIQMPIMDGIQLIKEIRNISVDIPIIACSAYEYPEDRINSLLVGINKFISKPFDTLTLKNIIQRTIHDYKRGYS